MRKTIVGGIAAIALAGAALVGLSSAAGAADIVTVPVPANPLVGSCIDPATLALPSVTGVTWGAFVDHKDLNGKVGISATAADGYQFANGATSKAYAAVQSCPVTLPQFDTTNVCQVPLANVTVPYTPHVKTYLYGVTGYDQNVAITGPVNVTRAMAGQFWVSYTTNPGFVAANAGQWHIDFGFACDFAAPDVLGVGAKATPQYGDFHNGTWKVSSVTTLADGTGFTTHGGTPLTGPVVRYRLVFTPNTGYVLPATLPGDGFKVGTAAVFLVYVPAV